MAGLLEGLAAGLNAGIDSYNTAKKQRQDDENRKQQMRMDMASRGLIQDDSGNISLSPESRKDRAYERAGKQAGLAKAGYQIGDYDEAAGEYKINPIKGYKDPEDQAWQRELMKEQFRIASENRKQDANIAAEERRQKRDEEKITPERATASTYAQRIQDAEKTFGDLASHGFDRTNIKYNYLTKAGNAPLVGGLLKSSSAYPGELSQQDQAERNFVNAVLRRESGAAIAQSEFNSAEQQYFPRPGDSPETLKQKARNRSAALAGLLADAGPAFAKYQDQLRRIDNSASIPVQKRPGGLLPEATASERPALTPQDQEAIQWAKANPNDPMASEILRRNGVR